MRKCIGLGIAALVLGVAMTALSADQGGQTKTGVVKKVDVEGKKITVMVARELTFTVTDATKIVQGDAAKTLADIKVGANVTVEYTRDGDNRVAVKIAIAPPAAPAAAAPGAPVAPAQ